MNQSSSLSEPAEVQRSETIEHLLIIEDEQTQKQLLSILSRQIAGTVLDGSAQDCRAQAALISGYRDDLKGNPAKIAVYQQLFMLTEMLEAAATTISQNEYNEAQGYAQQILARLTAGIRSTNELIAAVVNQPNPNLVRRALIKLRNEGLIEGNLRDDDASLRITDDGIEAAKRGPSEN